VITLGTAIQDYRNNALRESYTLAFSTGPVLDTGEIRGQVFTTGKTQGLDVWAYLIPDSADVDPKKESPEYIVQCDAGGRFEFTHLAPGPYRLFAVRDRVSDRRYRPVEDEIGLTFRDVRLDSGNTFRDEGLVFKTSVEDTILPRLDRAVAADPQRIALNFTEPVRFDSTRRDWIALTSASDSLQPLAIEAAYSDPDSKRRIFLLTEELRDKETYRIRVEGIADFAGYGIDTAACKTEFIAAVEPDTSAPNLATVFPEPRSRNIPLESAIRLCFDEPMDAASGQGIVFSDSAGTPVAGASSWKRPSEWIFRPERPLLSLAPYTIRLKPDSVLDCRGNALVDTVWQFWTLEEDTLGAVAGTILDPDTSARGPVFVSVSQLDKPEIIRVERLESPGPYEIAKLFPAKYRIEAFRDEDGDGKYTFGRLSPYSPAERFVVHPDTLAIRSGWVKEGYDLSLPKP
jgi:hypothetical protein